MIDRPTYRAGQPGDLRVRGDRWRVAPWFGPRHSEEFRRAYRLDGKAIEYLQDMICGISGGGERR